MIIYYKIRKHNRINKKAKKKLFLIIKLINKTFLKPPAIIITQNNK